MPLPIKTDGEDVRTVVEYLKTKATGATIEEAKSVLNKNVLDSRKLNAYVLWGFLTRDGDRLKLDTLGRELGRLKPENDNFCYAKAVHGVKVYQLTIEWIYHQGFDSVTNVEVAAHWHEHYRQDIGSDSENTIKDMAVCFFHLCESAKLGILKIGRKGQPTRFEIFRDAVEQFVAEDALDYPQEVVEEKEPAQAHTIEIQEEEKIAPSQPIPAQALHVPTTSKVFISHGNNMAIVDQIKTMLEVAELEYEIAEEEETTAIPVPDKVLSAMRNCNAAVICVSAEEKEKNGDKYRVNTNVLIEIGAAFVLYEKRVVLVWDKRVEIPSNLQGLYRCEYSGDDLSWTTGMKLMQAVKKFKSKG